MRLWDLTGPTPRCKVLPGGWTHPYAVALSPDGRYLATGNQNGSIYIRKLASRGEVFRVP